MNSREIFLVDSGTGNLHSVEHTLLSLGAQVRLVRKADELRRGGRVILPGVGAFGKFMQGLQSGDLIQALVAIVQGGDPLLGICVGMQALFESSDEMGEFAGLGILPGRVVRFPQNPGFKVPHTGWNQLTPTEQSQASGSPLLRGLAPGAYAYFNHSFYCAPARMEHITAVTEHGVAFASMVQHDNVMGVQFHPEKSQQTGLKMLENFIKT